MLYVDDLIIIGGDFEHIRKNNLVLQAEFEMIVDIGPLHVFLGLEIW